MGSGGREILMSSAESFHQLTAAQQRQVHLTLCEHALTIWTAHVTAHAPIRYVDTVVGMRHEVDVALPADALQSARAGADIADVERRYQEPIAALQDDDLEFPEAIEFAYYAIYNCFCKHACGEKSDPWLIVNQALSSDADQQSWAPRLERAIAAAK